MASFNKFNCFVQDVANALHDMKTGTAHVYKVYLTNTAPVATNTVYNTPADLSAANGYTAGGGQHRHHHRLADLRARSSSPAAPTRRGPPRAARSGRFNMPCSTIPRRRRKPLIGWWDYGTPLTLTNGNTFTVDLDQVNGILTIT